MTTREKLRAAAALGIPALLATLACEAQVGEQYTGEILFSLEGSVDLDPETQLVPRIAFRSGGPSIDGPEALEVVGSKGGKVSGEFPAKFRLDVTEPPPKSAFDPVISALAGVRGQLAYGVLVMLAPNHPTTIPRARIDEDEWCDYDDGPCRKTMTNCDTNGRCRERELECVQHACEVYATSGDPIATDDFLDYLPVSGSDCEGSPFCYGADGACSSSGCFLEFSECDMAALGPYDDANGSNVERCTLQRETGDTSLISIADINTASISYGIVYVTEDSPDSLLGPLEQGYNLVTIPYLSKEEWVRQATCSWDASVEALAKYNEEQGTQYRYAEIMPDDVEQKLSELEREIQLRNCPPTPIGSVVKNAEIEIQLGRPPFIL